MLSGKSWSSRESMSSQHSLSLDFMAPELSGSGAVLFLFSKRRQGSELLRGIDFMLKKL